jgi:hypothetical protein
MGERVYQTDMYWKNRDVLFMKGDARSMEGKGSGSSENAWLLMKEWHLRRKERRRRQSIAKHQSFSWMKFCYPCLMREVLDAGSKAFARLGANKLIYTISGTNLVEPFRKEPRSFHVHKIVMEKVAAGQQNLLPPDYA